MIVKVFLTLHIDEDEYPVPVDGEVDEEIDQSLQEFIYDHDFFVILTLSPFLPFYDHDHRIRGS